MSGIAKQFKIKLRQNMWGLLLSFAALGASEYYHLCTLYWFSLVTSVIYTLSVAVTTLTYTIKVYKQETRPDEQQQAEETGK